MEKIYIQELYDQDKHPTDIATDAEDETNEQDKGPIMLKTIKDIRRRKATGDDHIPVDLIKELGDSGFKIMTEQVNKISYMMQ